MSPNYSKSADNNDDDDNATVLTQVPSLVRLF